MATRMLALNVNLFFLARKLVSLKTTRACGRSRSTNVYGIIDLFEGCIQVLILAVSTKTLVIDLSICPYHQFFYHTHILYSKNLRREHIETAIDRCWTYRYIMTQTYYQQELTRFALPNLIKTFYGKTNPFSTSWELLNPLDSYRQVADGVKSIAEQKEEELIMSACLWDGSPSIEPIGSHLVEPPGSGNECLHPSGPLSLDDSILDFCKTCITIILAHAWQGSLKDQVYVLERLVPHTQDCPQIITSIISCFEDLGLGTSNSNYAYSYSKADAKCIISFIPAP